MRTLPVNDVLFSELLRLEKLKKNADFVFCNLRTGKTCPPNLDIGNMLEFA
jgi:hypothetical protein